ncbi:DUF1501 domain-containing protein [Bordetella petrii]|uniref:DUF1501 domain-containing protein n=1 Tax=Bordetella petrii TaxID=94624 RepID=UPI001E3A5C5A|nr:DUF1501 domain-containing protein [Bordetella petrii]MCD0502393.1 DUF1501 domain-containing protein [Bordetella petrii]
MQRRHLLKLAATAPLALLSTRLLAAPRGNPRLLVVFMRGAYDCNSLLVPAHSDFYYESRPTIAIAKPGSGTGAALPLADGWALHPALKDTLLPLYQAGELAFVPFAGTDDLSRSHFDTQHGIELGRPGRRDNDYRSGFLNRLATQLGQDRAGPVSFTGDLPQIWRGDFRVPNVDLGGSRRRPGLGARRADAIESMYRDTELAAAVQEGIQLNAMAQRDLAEEMQKADGKAMPASQLEREASRIGRFMAGKYNLGFIDVGGWDTHVGQGGASGQLANKLGQLGRALVAYKAALGPAWRDTTVVVISEFGRTFRENGNKGTDHGHGTVYWVLGGTVQGGRIAGRQVDVRRDTLFQDRDYPVLNDYRSLFAGLFGRLYGLDARRVEQVFPGARPRDLKLV